MFDLLMALPPQGSAQSTSSGKPLTLGANDLPAQTPFSQVLKQRYVGAPLDSSQPAPASLLPTPVAEEIAAVLSQAQSASAQSNQRSDLDVLSPTVELHNVAEELPDDSYFVEHKNESAAAMQPVEQSALVQADRSNPQVSQLTVETSQPRVTEELRKPVVTATPQPIRADAGNPEPIAQELRKQVEPAQPQPIRAGLEAAQPAQPIPSRLTVETIQPLPQELLKQAHQPAAMLARIENSLAQSARLRETPAAQASIATMPQEIQTADTTWVRPLANSLSATAEPLVSATVAQQAPQTSFVAANGAAAEAQVNPVTTSSSELNIAPMQTASAAPTPTTTLSAPLATPAWQAQLSQQVSEQAQQIVNMRVQNDQTVRLRLHPAELGPLMISMKVEDQSAQLQFVSAHSQVRQAVEQALPQLREILAEQGIELSQSSVRDHGAHDQHQEQSHSNPQTHGLESETLADNNSKSESILATELTVGLGRVNVFA